MTTNNAVNNGLSGATGTGNFVGSTSPTITTPNIVGVTNASNAAAGSVGEFITSNILKASAVSAPTGVATNITSVTLSAGDWNLFGNVGVIGSQSYFFGWMSQSSATQPDDSNSTLIQGSQNQNTVTVPYLRVNTSVQTTVYLSILVSGTSNTAYGTISARRVR